MTKNELVLWMVRDLASLRHYGMWAVSACYDLAYHYGIEYPPCPKQEVVDAVVKVLRDSGKYD